MTIARPSKGKSSIEVSKSKENNPAFDVRAFLDSAGLARKVTEYRKGQKIFVMYIQKGGVKISVANENGKEAVVAILGPADFFGMGCLAGQRFCMATATAVSATSVLAIEKQEMLRVLHSEHSLSDRFTEYLLTRNIRTEEDLVDQLFNSSEKRLARTLLLLAHYGGESKPTETIPKISQETLADMIGTTRSRVNVFMNKFRKLGFIHYNGGLQVHSSLLSVVLHE
jgi:CRP/FNR family cyclic AMP-dependent transcriptional regulator